jgi:ribosomal protein S12 methylthiotransferase
MRKIHITSLGCAKNLVDSEVLAGQLAQRNFKFTDYPKEADLVIINTCGFIEDAKKESIQAIFEALELKTEDKDKKVFVTGCLSQRYRDELTSEIPEIDAIFGTEDYGSILSQLGDNHFHSENMYLERQLLGPAHYAYIKISEGCNHTCAFCAIPNIRGRHRSRSIEEIISEAVVLAENGVQELILVSQDTSYYGKDLYSQQRIVQLLESLAKAQLFKWIRPLYWYPTNFPLEYISLMNKYDSIIPYVDMPIQHASDRMLCLMKRAETKNSLINLYKEIRAIRTDCILRTTLILGHPGESADDFAQLEDFLEEIRFDRIGTFVYSDEDGTAAYELGNKVDTKIATRRRDKIMSLQCDISEEKNREHVATIQTVLIDSYDEVQKYYVGRTYRDAPEIDNEVIICDHHYQPALIGTFRNVKILEASEYELYGKFIVT